MARKHKSLHESAAEILAASVATAGKEPMPMTAMMMEPPADLGGATTMAEPSALGAAASETMAMAPKAGKSGAPAEPIKVAPEQAEEIADEDEALKDNPVDTGKMKVKVSEESQELEGEALVESLIAEHGAEYIVESLISEHGEEAVFNVVMEEYVNEYGAEVVQEAYVETLFEQFGEENAVMMIAESIIREFGEQEFTDEEFASLQEDANEFASQIEDLSEDDLVNYISELNEEELVYAIQLSSLNEGFFKKIGKALKKVGKKALKVVAKAAPVLSFIPGVGTAVGAVAGKLLGGIGSKIAGSALGKAVSAGVSKLGGSALGKVALEAGKGALKGGVSSVLQGGKFKEGAKLGAISGVASPLVNKVAGGLTNLTGSETIGQTAADALAGGVASKALGGKFSQGAKTGAISSLVGRAAKGFGDVVRGKMGDAAGDLTRDAVGAYGDAATNRRSAQQDYDYDYEDETAPAEDEETPRTNVSRNRRRMTANRGGRRAELDDDYLGDVNEQVDQIISELSTLNEEQLENFLDSLEEDQAEFIGSLIEERTRGGQRNRRRAELDDDYLGDVDSRDYRDQEYDYDPRQDNYAPAKTGIGLFYDPYGNKTALRKAIPNELVAMKDVIGNLFKIKELGWQPGTNRFGYPEQDLPVRRRRTNENFEDSNMNGEDTTMETTELTEEQIREERMNAIKETVKQFKGTMREDVDALFNGESLSEEFRAKATLIFESAVTSRVESILEKVVEQNDVVLSEAYEEIKGQLTEQVDEYLNYVVEQWMEENKVAVETGLRAELAEDFIAGLRSLFQEHYIEIPEEKVDVAETLAAELENAGEYVQSVQQHVEEQEAVIADLQEQLNAVKKEKSIDNFCEGLTAVQAAKMKSLAEGVEFTTEGDFEEKLAVLRENYFPTKVQVKSEVKEIQKAMLNEEPEVEQVNNIMNRYVKAISKTAPKA